MPSLKSCDNSNMPKLKIRAIRYLRTYPNYRKALLLNSKLPEFDIAPALGLFCCLEAMAFETAMATAWFTACWMAIFVA